jgi:hypothetical protein
VVRLAVRFAGFLVLMMIAASALAQTEFSADIVNTDSAKTPTKVYFGKSKIRFEMSDKNMPGGAVILDYAAQHYLVLMPQKHIYMDMPQMMDKGDQYAFFRIADAENACAQWLKLPKNQGGTCHKVGSETVNGRNTVKYEGVNSSGESSTVWIDPKLGFPVKWQRKNSGGEIRNIQEGPQPESLFEIPPGLTKMDMSGMMQPHQ